LLRSDQIASLQRAGFTVVDWTVSAAPMLYPHVPLAAEVGALRSGSILLIHDGRHDRSNVVKMLPSLIRALRARHFKIVTLGRLLQSGRPRYELPEDICERARMYRADGFVSRTALRACRTRHRRSRRHVRADDDSPLRASVGRSFEVPFPP